MNEQETGPSAGEGARWARARKWLARAKGSAGYERYTLEMIGKSALAATLAWYLAQDVLAAPSPAFAPFSAVLMIQVTVYQSLWHSLRYVAAVCAGVVVQAGLGLLIGPYLVTFALVALIALAIGRSRRLGPQSGQVPTAAFFAFSTYVSASSNTQRLTELGQILLLVVVGCAIGVLVNVLVLPPMRYRGAEESVRALARSLCDLLSEIPPVLREGAPDEDRTREWRRRADQQRTIVDQARAALRTAEESKYLNPRRLWPGHRETDFSGYSEVVAALERVAHQVGSLTRTLEHWPTAEDSDTRYTSFLADCAELLASLSRVTEQLSGLTAERLPEQAAELCRAGEAAGEQRDALVARAQEADLPLGDPSLPYGILLAEARRLTDEAQYTCDVLQRAVDEGRHSGELLVSRPRSDDSGSDDSGSSG